MLHYVLQPGVWSCVLWLNIRLMTAATGNFLGAKTKTMISKTVKALLIITHTSHIAHGLFELLFIQIFCSEQL